MTLTIVTRRQSTENMPLRLCVCICVCVCVCVFVCLSLCVCVCVYIYMFSYVLFIYLFLVILGELSAPPPQPHPQHLRAGGPEQSMGPWIPPSPPRSLAQTNPQRPPPANHQPTLSQGPCSPARVQLPERRWSWSWSWSRGWNRLSRGKHDWI